MKFQDYLSFDDFSTLATMTLSKVETQKERDKYKKVINDTIAPVFKTYFQDLNVPQIAGSETHDNPFTNGFNKLARGEEVVEWSQMVEPFSKELRLTIMRNDEDLPMAYSEFAKKMDSGNFSVVDLSIMPPMCQCCEQFICVGFKNWQGTAGKLTNSGFKPLDACTVEKIQKIDVEYKTGNLLVSDWFRIQEFNDAVEFKATASIGSTKGRVERTNHLAKLGVISISILNSSPDIFVKEGKLVIGDYGYDPVTETRIPATGDYLSAGRISTQFFGATVVERERLEEIIAEKVGVEKAKNIVAEYMRDGTVTELQVNPGKYKVSFSGNSENFGNLVKERDYEFIQPYVIFEATQPKNTIKKKMK